MVVLRKEKTHITRMVQIQTMDAKGGGEEGQVGRCIVEHTREQSAEPVELHARTEA